MFRRSEQEEELETRAVQYLMTVLKAAIRVFPGGLPPECSTVSEVRRLMYWKSG